MLALDEDIAEVAQRQALEEIEGIGRDLSEKIQEFLRTGKIALLETLRIPLPEHIREWAGLPGLSESLVAYLYSRLNIAHTGRLGTARTIAHAQNGAGIFRFR